MNSRVLSWPPMIALLFALHLAVPAPAMDAQESMGHNLSEMKFVNFPALPTCTTGSVQDGNPLSGPSVIMVKVAGGCVIPWHWHTANEHLMMVSGKGRVEMKDGRNMILKRGGFAKMPARHVHMFTCKSGPCEMYLYSDAIFDIHYVDAQETELSPDIALKAFKEKQPSAEPR